MVAVSLKKKQTEKKKKKRGGKTELHNAEIMEKCVPKFKTRELKDKAIEVMHHFGLTPGSTTKAKRDQIQAMLYNAARTAVLEGPPKPRGVDMNDYAFSLIDVKALILHALRA